MSAPSWPSCSAGAEEVLASGAHDKSVGCSCDPSLPCSPAPGNAPQAVVRWRMGVRCKHRPLLSMVALAGSASDMAATQLQLSCLCPALTTGSDFKCSSNMCCPFQCVPSPQVPSAQRPRRGPFSAHQHSRAPSTLLVCSGQPSTAPPPTFSMVWRVTAVGWLSCHRQGRLLLDSAAGGGQGGHSLTVDTNRVGKGGALRRPRVTQGASRTSGDMAICTETAERGTEAKERSTV